ncbi:hypothetical protein K7432_001002 [Basidiobolus ranarum]|uniref:Uncharacterized protein n=1 Tax=Basidiobolus ranarum TaxID=34480 RepID=A0ABR2X439_9FUNG
MEYCLFPFRWLLILILMRVRCKSLLVCLSAMLFSQSLAQSTGYGSGSKDPETDKNDPKATDKTIPYSKLPEKERPESLFVGKFEADVDCLHMVKQAEKENPVLKECYTTTGLFFSPLTKVCSSKCFDQTVKASKLIAGKCDTQKSGGNSKDLVFTSWSIMENAKIYCSKAENSYCVRKIKDFELTALERKKGVEPTEEKKTQMCPPCIKDIYTLVKDYLAKNTVLPRVYYDQPKHLEDIVPEIEKVCGNKLSLGSASKPTK